MTRNQVNNAYTLVEIVAVLAILTILITLMLRLPFGWRRDVLHLNYGHTVEARLKAASTAAMLTGFNYSVKPKQDGRGLIWEVEQPTGKRLWFDLAFDRPFAIQLADHPLPHPTMNGDLERAWPASIEQWRIKADGHSGGYFVVSDGRRTMCHLLAGSGQIRTFRWDRRKYEWVPLL